MKKGIDWDKKAVDPHFCEWAFGHGILDAVFDDPTDLLKAWNSLHGEALNLSEEGNMFDDLREMEALWNAQLPESELT